MNYDRRNHKEKLHYFLHNCHMALKVLGAVFAMVFGGLFTCLKGMNHLRKNMTENFAQKKNRKTTVSSGAECKASETKNAETIAAGNQRKPLTDRERMALELDAKDAIEQLERTFFPNKGREKQAASKEAKPVDKTGKKKTVRLGTEKWHVSLEVFDPTWSPKKKKLVASATAACLVIVAVGSVCIFGGKDSKETKAPIQAPLAQETQELLDVVENQEEAAGNFLTIPRFQCCSVVGESIEKDLTIYFNDEEETKIGGSKFQVKLIAPEDKEILTEALEAIAEINLELEDMESQASAGEEEVQDTEELSQDEESREEEDKDSQDGDQEATEEISATEGTSSTEVPEAEEIVEELAESDYLSADTGETLSEKEKLLLAKEQVLLAYGDVLDTIEGSVYIDNDNDGMIYVDSIESGDYVACMLPMKDYDAENYAVDVNVKENITYEAVNVKNRTVTAAKAGDVNVTHANTQEVTLTNTVEYVESSTSQGQASTEPVRAAALKASLSAQTNSTSNGYVEPSTQMAGRQVESSTDTNASANTYAGTNTSADNSTLLLAANEPASLSVSQTATLYSDAKNADSLTLVVNSLNISNMEATSDTKGISVKKSGSSYIVTASGIKEDTEGLVTISGKDPDGELIKVSCQIKVKGNQNPLLDASGNELYLDVQASQPALQEDYDAEAYYYCVTGYGQTTYYGWQTLDGVRYYFDKNGNKVSGYQVINGVTYAFNGDGSLMTNGYGIDVSKWNGSINWAQASTAVNYAIIRAGFRGTSGSLALDPTAGANITGAASAGVKVGLYVYSRALNEAQAVEEASLAISVANTYGNVSLPIYIDMEDESTGGQGSLTVEQRDAIARAFCTTVNNAGYKAGIYANKYWMTSLLTTSSYPSTWSIWCAQYAPSCTFGGRYDLWQYSKRGAVPGISGEVDMDRGYF